MRNHNPNSSRYYKCETCKTVYTTALGFRCHLVRHVKSAPDIKCNSCDKMFYTKEEARSHSHAVHKPMKHPCEYCGKVYAKPCFLREHINVKHKSVDLKVPCPQCGRTFATKNRMVNHITMMHRETQCTECGETFSNSTKLTHHQLTFHQKLRYRCLVPGCFKEYVRKAKVNDHFALKHSDLNREEQDEYHKIMKKMKPT